MLLNDYSLDVYGILNLSKYCSKADIKRTYRELALANHPGKNQNEATSSKIFQDVSVHHYSPMQAKHADRNRSTQPTKSQVTQSSGDAMTRISCPTMSIFTLSLILDIRVLDKEPGKELF
jgi:DnaJ-class molecular chaperone